MEIVEEHDSTRLVNSLTWSKKIRGERWSAEETALFFDAVRMFGSDFEMITQLFPGRNRKQIRLKWRKEEKKAPQIMTDMMMGRQPPSRASVTPSIAEEENEDSEIIRLDCLNTFEEYAKWVGIDCTGPIPEDPMDKWREKERLEDLEMRKANEMGSKKTGDEDEDEEDDDDEVIEEEIDTAAWGQ
ncbi:hypothetical protein DFH28DRAFT_992858 [Melampsora americana]|nr:hypothetical protein DFH28DRAFT_992858 [Melampsora americana]